MIPPALEPTPLVDAADRPAVVVKAIHRPNRWRGSTVAVRWLLWLIGDRLRALVGRRDPKDSGRRLRELLAQLGGVWIKAGQLLSLRIDLFELAFCQELAQLQDRADGFPGEIAQQVIEQDLGVPLAHVFAEFELQPIAAASIGQVHRARLRDGRVVAVKVRRPFIELTLERELALVGRLFAVLAWLRVASFMRWGNMRWELGEILREEIDYRREASSMERLHASLRGRGMYVPVVHAELSTTRVLVMEFVSGVLMSDYIVTLRAEPERVRAWERENDVDPHRVVRRFSASILKQIVEDNLFHGDLHPGNIILLRGSRVALLDFGSVGLTDADYLQRFWLFMQALAGQEYERAADLALLMAASLPDIDIAPVRAEIARELLAWGLRTGVAGLPYTVKSADAVNVAITRIFFKHRITFEWAFLRIRRALATMDATAMHLYPDADYTALMSTYLRHASRRALRHGLHQAAATPPFARIEEGDEVWRRVSEVSELAVEIERGHLRVASAAVSDAGTAIDVVAVATAAVASISAAIALMAWAVQHGPAWIATPVIWLSAGFAGRLPLLDWQIWLLAGAASVLIARAASSTRPSRRSWRATSARRPAESASR